jgi:hypothetical protein
MVGGSESTKGWYIETVIWSFYGVLHVVETEIDSGFVKMGGYAED